MLSLPNCVLCAMVAVAATAALVIPGAALAQGRVSIGAGAGIAGTTESTLSDGRTAPVVMGELAATARPVGAGLEVDGWLRDASTILIATGDLRVRLASTPIVIKLGAGVGRVDPDGPGSISGVAGHLGADCDIGLSASRALTLFANAFLVHAPARSYQMVNGGLAITWR